MPPYLGDSRRMCTTRTHHLHVMCMAQDYSISSVLLSLVLVVSVFGAIVVAALLVALQVAIENRNLARLRRLKYVKDRSWVQCKPLADPQAFHLFRASQSLDSWISDL